MSVFLTLTSLSKQGPCLENFLLDAEDGLQALEYLLVLAFGGLPMAAAILLFEDVLRESIEVTTLILTSPFF